MLILEPSWPFSNRLLSDLARQFCSCGIFLNVTGTPGDKDREFERQAVDEFAAPRLGLLQSVLRPLARRGLVRVDDGIPYSFNRGEWRPEDGVSKYTTIGSHELGSILQSYFSTWRLDLLENTTSIWRQVKCLLWQHRNAGARAAIRFAARCLRQGLFSNDKSLSFALCSYLSLLQRSESDTEVFRQTFGGTIPADEEAWIATDLDEEQITSRDSLDAGLLQDPLTEMIRIAKDACDVARSATSYDQWLVQQFFLRKYLNVIFWITGRLEHQPGIALRATLSFLDEVRADSGGAVRFVQEFDPLGTSALCNIVEAIAIVLMHADKDNWRQNLMSERASCPAALLPTLAAQRSLTSASDLPGWRGVSAMLAPAVLIGARSQDPRTGACMSWSTDPLTRPSKQQVIASAESQLDVIESIQDAGAQIRLEEIRQLGARYPLGIRVC